MTDPAWLDAFRARCGIADDLTVLLTISLSDPWEDGYCYKLAAGILPLSPGLGVEAPKLANESPRSNPATRPMAPREAIPIIQTLADGTDPSTHQPLRGDSPFSNPDTVRALQAAAAALERVPVQAGQTWDKAEEDILVRQFDGGETFPAIARAHGRTRGAIKARLALLGKITNGR